MATQPRSKSKSTSTVVSETVGEDGLTGKQRAFVDAYLDCLNATEAARRAKYKGNDNTLGVTGYDNLRNPKIARIIRSRLAEMSMPREEVLARLSEYARGEASRYVCVPKKGKPYINLARLIRDGKQHLIKGINYSRTGDVVVETYDAQAALVQLGRYHKLFTDVIEDHGKEYEAYRSALHAFLNRSSTDLPESKGT